MTDNLNVKTDGDQMVVETAFGTARMKLSDDEELAQQDLRDSVEEDWLEMDLEDRWIILMDEVKTAMSYYQRGDL